MNRSVLYDVSEKLPPEKLVAFFTRDERNWADYLQGQDAFTPEAYARLQAKQREILASLLAGIKAAEIN